MSPHIGNRVPRRHGPLAPSSQMHSPRPWMSPGTPADLGGRGGAPTPGLTTLFPKTHPQHEVEWTDQFCYVFTRPWAGTSGSTSSRTPATDRVGERQEGGSGSAAGDSYVTCHRGARESEADIGLKTGRAARPSLLKAGDSMTPRRFRRPPRDQTLFPPSPGASFRGVSCFPAL